MITATITRTIPIHQLRPGHVLPAGDHGDLVDAIELTATGATALCYPNGRTGGRRIRRDLGPVDQATTVVANTEEADQAIRDLASHVKNPDPGPDDPYVRDIVFPGDALIGFQLTSGWTIALHGDHTPDDEDEDQGETERAEMLADIDAADEDD